MRRGKVSSLYLFNFLFYSFFSLVSEFFRQVFPLCAITLARARQMKQYESRPSFVPFFFDLQK